MSATDLNIRGNIKRVLRERFPSLPTADLEALAEELAAVAQDYAQATRDAARA